MSRRYAIYFAPPPGSDLEAFGRRWLGRDHVTGDAVDQLRIDGIDPEIQARITRSARHYGFHATLKAPFELKAGKSAQDLHGKAREFVALRSAFAIPPLTITRISKWIAFTLAEPSEAMNILAADCVRDLDDFRAEPAAADLERRRKSGLTPRQDRHLTTYGYPHIFEDFHFHMTLAGPLDPAEQEELHRLLLPLAPAIGEDEVMTVDAIAIYEQPSRDQPFIQTARLPFGLPRSS
ncbi:MAG: DUF1045 domain-containing protein [Geminicoccaceae bacterium]